MFISSSPLLISSPAPQVHEAGLEFQVDLGQVFPTLVDRLLGRQRGPQLGGHDGRGGRLIRLKMEDSFSGQVLQIYVYRVVYGETFLLSFENYSQKCSTTHPKITLRVCRNIPVGFVADS